MTEERFESVTYKNVVSDIVKSHLVPKIALAAVYIVASLLLLGFLAMVGDPKADYFIVAFIVGMLPILCMLIFAVVYVVKIVSVLIPLLRNDLRIVSDSVQGHSADYRHRSGELPFRRHRAYIISFKSYGMYEIPNVNYYSWSKYYSYMNSAKLCQSADYGEEFYLVTDKKEKILAIYNKKLFVLNDPELKKFMQ